MLSYFNFTMKHFKEYKTKGQKGLFESTAKYIILTIVRS